MKLALIAVAALIVGACSLEKTPVDPTSDPDTPSPIPFPTVPAPTTDGWLWAMAVRTDGSCIPGATFTVVSGPSYVGEVLTQQTPCSVWDYGDVGIMLRGPDAGCGDNPACVGRWLPCYRESRFCQISWHRRKLRPRVGSEAGLIPTENVVLVGTIAAAART